MGAQAVRLSNVDIDNALKNRDFEVLYQPIFDLAGGAFARVETFVRWRHPTLGLLPPGAFISYFESQGRMSELTRYVFDKALTEYIAWRGASAPGFSINLAISDLADDALGSHLTVLLRKHNFPAAFVTLECPMPPVDMDPTVAAAHFSRLAATGARLAIEVRGRANDLLKQASPLPFAEIKTGGAAILRFARTVRGPGLSAISELLDIARSNGAMTTAVGVEDQASLSALQSLGFSCAQGNYLSPVGKLDEFSTGMVNDVRRRLGLTALTTDEVAALFRTADGQAKHDADAPIRRAASAESLDARSARPSPSYEAFRKLDPAKRQAARAALAAKKKAISAAKAAAIAKAKRKRADAVGADETPHQSTGVFDASEVEGARPTFSAARGLLERLSQAFSDTGSHVSREEDGVQPASSIDPASSNERAPEYDDGETQSALKRPEFERNVMMDDNAGQKKTAPSDARDAQANLACAGFARFAPFVAVHVDHAVRFGGPSGRPRAPRDSGLLEFRLDDGLAPRTPEKAGEIATSTLPMSPPGPSHARMTDVPAPVSESDLREGPEVLVLSNKLIASEPDARGGGGDGAPRARRPRPRKPKSFLERRYDIRWPDHFWPKSWKKRWRKMRAGASQRASSLSSGGARQ